LERAKWVTTHGYKALRRGGSSRISHRRKSTFKVLSLPIYREFTIIERRKVINSGVLRRHSTSPDNRTIHNFNKAA
jgi:hypothetical protein